MNYVDWREVNRLSLVDVLVDVLVVVVLYLVASWVNVKLKLNLPDEILKIGVIIILIFALLGKVNLIF